MGATVEDQEVERVLAALGMETDSTDSGWTIDPPSWRFDIAIEEGATIIRVGTSLFGERPR